MIFNADTADDSQRAQGRVVREASASSAFTSTRALRFGPQWLSDRPEVGPAQCSIINEIMSIFRLGFSRQVADKVLSYPVKFLV